VGPAAAPQESSNLGVLIYVAVGGVAGLVIGLVVAVGLELMRLRGGLRWIRAEV
jgi:hypothetical protein